MGPRTRSAANSPVKKSPTSTVSTGNASTPAPDDPRKILLIPADLSCDARLLLLPHPRDGTKKRFLFCPIKGLFEFSRIAAPTTEFRSILLVNEESDTRIPNSSDMTVDEGYINKDANILVATPFDVLFLLLPLLPSSMTSSAKVLFQPLDDLLDTQLSEHKHLQHLVSTGRQTIEARLHVFCDTIDAGDETMFRINEDKILKTLARKAEKVVEQGLPISLEERFVTRALDAPVLSVKREDVSVTTIEQSGTPSEDADTKTESFDSQSTTASSAPSVVFSEVSVASSVTTMPPEPASEPISAQLKHLQRLKVALDFIMASYMPLSLSRIIDEKMIAGKLLADFEPLHRHLKTLATLRAEAIASRSLTDFNRKRGNADDDEAAEERAEKKRKLDEEEKRKKAGESRGVRDLKKVNVSGMKKMSDFFTKKAAAAAKAKAKA